MLTVEVQLLVVLVLMLCLCLFLATEDTPGSSCMTQLLTEK